MKDRTSSLLVGGVIVLALIGVTSMVFKDPATFIKGIAVIVLIGIAIYVIVRLIFKASPQKKEQRAFLKAAKQSKKRLQKKSGDFGIRSASTRTIATTLKKAAKRKKKTTAHLTVIDGKKGKKKNRASF